ncbi:MAG: redoxin domain-containing protein [Verrucomicrobia bacterium]|nr:redoxin domain-containing protein [Verrucomicrobiota bacterium]
MKLRVCLLVAVIAWAGLRAADSTNTPPREAAASDADAVFTSDPRDSAGEVLGLRRIRDTLARRPADNSGDAIRDWLVTVVVRCEQFLGDQPRSSHVAEVRAVNAQCRQELAALTGDRAEHDKALQLARQSLAKNDRGPGAARSRLVLARAAWPEDLGTVLEQTRLIVRDFSDQPPAAEAFWLLARAQQRKGDERAVREAAIGLFGSFPKSPEAAQARAMLRQLSLVAQPAPLPAVTTTDGKSLDLDALRGQALVLDFWTAATQPVSESAGVLRRLFEVRHDNGLFVVGVNLDTDRATFDKANAAHPTPWPQVFANDPANVKLMEAYPALMAPTRLLVDPFGLVARIAAHPAEIEPLMKRWHSVGALAVAAVPPAKPAAPVKPAVRTAAKAPPVVSKKEPPRITAAKAPAPKTKPAVEKRSVVAAKQPSKPTAPPPEKQIAVAPAPPPPMPAPQPTHIEIGGVLYAKPLSSATNALPVESTKPAMRVPSSVAIISPRPPQPVAKPFASTEKPTKLSRATTTAPSEPVEAAATAKPPAPAAKPFAGVEKPAKLGRVTTITPSEPEKPATIVASAKPPPPTAKPFASAEKPAKLGRVTTTAPSEPTEAATATKPPPAAKSSAGDKKPAKISRPTVVASKKTESATTPRPTPPAPAPTHIEIGGTLYAKPLRPATNAIPVETTKPTVKVTTPVVIASAKPPSPTAKPFASAEKPAKLGRVTTTAPSEPTEAATATKPPPAAKSSAGDKKPAKISRPTIVASKKAESAMTPHPTPPAAASKPRPGYGSSRAKSKLKTESAESLATMPDISETDRKASLIDAAKRILKSEEELILWSELESLFTTKKPASAEGSLVWYQDVADRCQQFVKDFPTSSHVNLVRINEARCRLILFQMKKDSAQRSRAETAAREVLAHKPNEDDAIRAEFLLLNATWPDHPEQGVAVAKRIVKDFPHRRETAAAVLMHAQFRRRQGMLHAAKEAAADLLKQFPESEFVFNARSLMKQCDLLNNPCPPAKSTGLRGEKMDIAAMKGKTLLIEFWSAKSKNVLEETTKLVQLYLRYHAKGFEIYTICVDKSREAMDIFQLQHPLPWPVYWDGQGYQGTICQQFGADTAPMRFLIEPGLQRIVSTHLSPEGVAAALNLWIDQSQPPLLPGQEPPEQGFFKKFFGLNL